VDEDRGEAVESGNRRPIGICGSDWAAIQKPSSSGIHPRQEKGSGGGIHIFETRKKGDGRRKESPRHHRLPLFPLEEASELAAQSVGELFCSTV